MERIQDNFPGSLTLSWYVEQLPFKTREGALGKYRLPLRPMDLVFNKPVPIMDSLKWYTTQWNPAGYWLGHSPVTFANLPMMNMGQSQSKLFRPTFL